jgi:hypothetical protein
MESPFLWIKRPKPRGSIKRQTKGPADQLPGQSRQCCCSNLLRWWYYCWQSRRCWDQKHRLLITSEKEFSQTRSINIRKLGGYPEAGGGMLLTHRRRRHHSRSVPRRQCSYPGQRSQGNRFWLHCKPACRKECKGWCR